MRKPVGLSRHHLSLSLAGEAEASDDHAHNHVDNYNFNTWQVTVDGHQNSAAQPNSSNHPGCVGVFYKKHKFFKHLRSPFLESLQDGLLFAVLYLV